jgi:ClpP class serine protease
MVDVEAVGTGETWSAHDAKGLGLVDELITSEEFLVELTRTAEVIKIKPPEPRKRCEPLRPWIY